MTISFVESIVLGFELSVNNLAGEFDAGVTHLSIYRSHFSAFSYVCVGVCAYLGLRYGANKFGTRASLVAGSLLILVSLHQLIS